ncbi:MAG TPA: hypothetical protein VK843_15225 [Planctomycetota bacterium]|nr:hypothetical protein [Planctomycetota bacterium]
MKLEMIRSLVVAAVCLALLASACRTTAPRNPAVALETEIPPEFAGEAPVASHTTFVPLAPSQQVGTPTNASFELRDPAGAVLETIRLVRSESGVFAGRADGSAGWYFLQNPVARAQFTGWRIDPGQQLLLQHSHSDVINEGIAHSWDEVATLGVDADLLSTMRATGERERAFDVEFVRYVIDGKPASSVHELWWNEELQLPLRIVRDVGGQLHTQVLVGFDKASDSSLLQLPWERFPSFTRIDLADWREGHHEESADASGAVADQHR